jgi:hypothetical protein
MTLSRLDLTRCGRALLLAGVVLVLCTGLALAGERIEFKNGHTMVVKSSRVEGDVVYLELPDGSEIGFPKVLIKDVEEGHRRLPPRERTEHAGRGPGLQDLPGYQRAARAAGRQDLVREGRLTSVSLDPTKRYTMGYTHRGSVDLLKQLQGTNTPPMKTALDLRRGGAGGEGSGGEATPKPGEPGSGEGDIGLQPKVRKKVGEDGTL